MVLQIVVEVNRWWCMQSTRVDRPREKLTLTSWVARRSLVQVESSDSTSRPSLVLELSLMRQRMTALLSLKVFYPGFAALQVYPLSWYCFKWIL